MKNSRLNKSVLIFSLLVLSIFLVTESHAASIYWRGTAASGSWSTTSNWSTVSETGGSCACTPAVGDDVYIGGTATSTITNVPTISTLNSLTVQTVSSVTLQAAAGVGGKTLEVTTLNLTGTQSLVISSTTNFLGMNILNGNISAGNSLTITNGNNRFLRVSGSLVITAGGSLVVNGTATFDGANQTLPVGINVGTGGHLQCAGSGSLTFPSSLIVNGVLTLAGNYSSLAGSPTTTYGASGNNTVNGIVYIGGVLEYAGTGAQISTSKELPTTGPNLIINNVNGVTLDHPASVVSLTLRQGNLITTSSNLLTVTGTATTSVRQISGYVNGPIEITLPANLSAGTTYLMPVGKSGYNPFELVDPVTGSSGSIVIRGEVFDANAGGTAGTGLTSLNTNRYWKSSITTNAANLTGTSVRLTDLFLGFASAIGQSTTQAGTYNSIKGVSNTTTGSVLSNTVTGSSYNTAGFFLMGKTSSDAGVENILFSYSPPFCNQLVTVQAIVHNYGTDSLKNIKIDWSINPGGAQPQASPAINIPPGSGQTVTLGTFNFGNTGIIYSISASTTNPNGTTDPNQPNDAFVLNGIPTNFSGNINVGTGNFYTTLTDAINNLNISGVCGPVTLLLTDATYTTAETFPIKIDSIPGASFVNTITIKPAPSVGSVLIEGAVDYNTSGPSGLLTLFSARHIIIDGSKTLGGNSKDLTISNTSVTTPTIDFDSAASHNTIKNCIVKGRNTNAYAVPPGGVILVGGEYGYYAPCDSNTIMNNDITRGATSANLGIFLQGSYLAHTANPQTGNIIKGNRVMGFGGSPPNGGVGIAVREYNSNFSISDNEIFEDAVQTNGLMGIDMWNGSYSWTVSGNNIHDLNTTSTGTITGMSLGGDNSQTSIVANNMITLINNTANTVRGFYNVTTSAFHTKIYFNTVYIGGSYGGATGTSTPYWRASSTSSGSGNELKNNILVNARFSSSPSLGGPTAIGYQNYGIVDDKNVGTFISDYNNIYVAQGNVYGFLKNSSTGDIASWDDWSTATFNDANSLHFGTLGSQNGFLPDFVDEATGNLHLNPVVNDTLDGQGIVIAGITTDYDGDTRSSGVRPLGPDIGADEFIFDPTFVDGTNNVTKSLEIYPNPVKNELSVMGLGLWTEETIVELYNVLGENIYRAKSVAQNSKLETIIDVRAIPAGVYFVKVTNGGEQGVGKFIKKD